MTPLTCDQALAQIRTPGSRPIWLVAAEAAENVCDSAAWRGHYALVGDWIAAAAGAAGIGSNMLRRWIAARRFLIEYDAAHPGTGALSMAEQAKISASAAEILKRMGEASPEKVGRVIDCFAGSGMSIRTLRQEYDSIVADVLQPIDVTYINPPYASGGNTGRPRLGAKLARRQLGSLEKTLFSLTNDQLAELSGDVGRTSLFYDSYKFRYMAPDAVAVTRREFGIDFLDGYSFKVMTELPKRPAFARLLADTAFAATFFRRYWLLIHGPKKIALEIAAEVTHLGLASVGVAVADPKAAKLLLEIVRPPERPPSPNRQDEAKEEVLKQGV